MDDLKLLKEYAARNSQEAFATLVQRHIGMVYSAALRQLRDPHLAEEISHVVFIILAKKSGELRENTILSGWLYRTTRFACADALKKLQRRQRREQEAYMQSTVEKSGGDSAWQEIEPHLDDALTQLGETDRNALVLRFFENRNLREVGLGLGVSEVAAQKRIARALEKLRALLLKRETVLPVKVLIASLSANAVQAAPAGLAATVATTAAVKGVATGASTLTLIKGALKFMAWTKTQVAIVSTIVVACAVTPLALQHQERVRLRDELRQRTDEAADLRAENQRLSSQIDRRNAMLRLPAPTMRAAVTQSQTLSESTNLISRLIRGENAPNLTDEQIQSYLNENQRSAASLVAAFRATGDQGLLREAMEKYPNDPFVNFAAVFSKDLSTEERRQQLNALQQSAPENALGDFLSALDYFKSGDTDRAVQELSAAYGKNQFADFTSELIQNSEEAYLAAGYSAAEAKTLATSQVLLPHLVELKNLGQNMIELANSYRQSGDETSAQAALQIAVNLGQRYDGSPGEPLISRLVGMAIERNALNAMNPNATFGSDAQTVNDRLQQLAQQNTQLHSLAQQFENVQHRMTPQDWVSYTDRWRTFGEQAAAQWLVNKYR